MLATAANKPTTLLLSTQQQRGLLLHPSSSPLALPPLRRGGVVMRFKENERPASASDVDNMEEKLHKGKPTDTKLSPEEIDSVSDGCCGEGVLGVVCLLPVDTKLSPEEMNSVSAQCMPALCTHPEDFLSSNFLWR